MTSNKEGTDVANRTILHDWLGILYSCVYLWVTVMYMIRLAPPGSQVLCKSGQIVLLPLFKPSALSLWPALMPMVQMVYWLSVSVRAAIMGPYAYVGIISPGKRPFELNVLTLIHAWLLSVPLLVYILATIFFAPLVLLFGIFLYRKSDAFFVSCLCCLQLLSFLVLDLTSFVLFFVALLLASFSSLSFPSSRLSSSSLLLVVLFSNSSFFTAATIAIGFAFMFIPMQLAFGRCSYYCCCCQCLCLSPRCRSDKRWNEVEQRWEKVRDDDDAASSSSSISSISSSSPTTGTDDEDNIADQIDLLALKALVTVFFSLFAASVYFAPYYFGTGGSWEKMVNGMVELPSFNLLSVRRMFENLELALTWPKLSYEFEIPTEFTVGVFFLQYSTEVVRWLYERWLKDIRVTQRHFAFALLPFKYAFAYASLAQVRVCFFLVFFLVFFVLEVFFLLLSFFFLLSFILFFSPHSPSSPFSFLPILLPPFSFCRRHSS